MNENQNYDEDYITDESYIYDEDEYCPAEECPYCGQWFNSKTALEKHLEYFGCEGETPWEK